MTDLELLDRYRIRGDKAALDQLVERYYSFVLRVCRRQLRNNADADDAAQQVFGHFLSHAPQVHTNVAAWLHRCAHNVSVSLVRSQIARRRSEQAYLEHGPRTHDGEANGDLLVALDECLATMPDHDRELIIQTQLLRVPQRVMAQQRGVSQQAVAKQLSRSLDRLRLAISARGVAITAAALVAALEGEASATLIALGAAAATPHLATAHLAANAATTLAATTKLKLLGTAVASVVLLSLPGTSDRGPIAGPQASLATVDAELAAPAALLALAPPRIAPQPLVQRTRDAWLAEPIVKPTRESRRGALAVRPSRAAAPTTIAPSRPTARKSSETGIAQTDPFAPRGTPPSRDWQRWEVSRWSSGGRTLISVPPGSTPPQSPSPVASPTVVHNSPGNAGPASTLPIRAAPTKTAHSSSVPPNSLQQAKPGSASIASSGGSAGGSSGSRSAVAPPSSITPSSNAPASSTVSLNAPPSGAAPWSATASNAPLNGIVSHVVQIRGPAIGTSDVDAPPPSVSPHSGAIAITDRPNLESSYEARSVASHGGPVVERSAYVDNFVLTLDDPKSVPVIDVPRMVQLSAPMLRMASAMIDPELAETLLVPLDAHDVVAIISDCISDQGDPSLLAMSVAVRSSADYGSPGLSPEQLRQIAGDDSYLPGHAGSDAYRAMSIHENFPDAICLPWMNGDVSAIKGSVIDGSSMVAVQLSTVPEPAAWQLAALAAEVILLVLLVRRFRYGRVKRLAEMSTLV